MGERFGRWLRGVIFAALLLSWAALTFGQEVLVTRNVNLRQDPSTTQPPIRLLQPPDRLELLSPEKTDGYYNVRTVEDEEGWVWAKNVRLLEGGIPAPEAVADSISPREARERFSAHRVRLRSALRRRDGGRSGSPEEQPHADEEAVVDDMGENRCNQAPGSPAKPTQSKTVEKIGG